MVGAAVGATVVGPGVAEAVVRGAGTVVGETAVGIEVVGAPAVVIGLAIIVVRLT